MPAFDLYHNAIKQALIKDGWIITHDPLHLRWGRKDMYVDLGAKRLILATRAEEKIAVEVKSFVSASEDETEDGVTYELVDAGIPKDQIVLGFHPAHLRSYTGYALA